MNTTTDPTRISPVIDHYRGAAYQPGDCLGMKIALNGAAIDADKNTLVDISAIPKRLVAGRQSAQWLAQYYSHVPEQLFEMTRSPGGEQCTRLHYQQYLLIAGHQQSSPAWLAHAPGAYDVVLLAYECAEFALFGPMREAIVHELSVLDSAHLKPNTWVATRLAHAEVAIWQAGTGNSHWRLACSAADAFYVFGVLLDISKGHDGQLTTIDAYLDLMRASTHAP